MAKKPLPTPEQLRQLLRYDPSSGKLLWRERTSEHKSFNARLAGKEAGCVSHKGYRKIRLPDGRLYYSHRIAWAIAHDEWPEGVIDHINHDASDNRLANLRAVTPKENNRNSGPYKNNRSGHMGVYRHARGKWCVQVCRQHVGIFDSMADAIEAQRAAAKRVGVHRNHGVNSPPRR